MTLDPQTLEQLTEQLHTWQHAWKPRLERWLVINQEEQPDYARLFTPFSDLLLLVMNLIKDPHLPDSLSEQLLEVMEYVFDSYDRLPEAELGVVGLVDDAIQVVDVLQGMIARYTPLLRTNWPGKGDVIELIESIYENRDKYLPGES